MRHVTGYQSKAVKVLLVLTVGVSAGLVVGGAAHFFGSDSSDAAQAAPVAGGRTHGPVLPPGRGPLRAGPVVADDAAGGAAAEPALGTVRTADGAAAAFTSYATWLVGSPAAAQDPARAIRAVGGPRLDPTDARLVAAMQRAPGDGFAASRGAYRVLGHAGDERSPDEVMIEVTAPLTVAGNTRWGTVGGVVTWTSAGWQLTSIKPREVSQPASTATDAQAMSAADRAKVFKGLGWQRFARPAGR